MRSWIRQRFWVLGTLLAAVTFPSASRAPDPEKAVKPHRPSRPANRPMAGASLAVTVQVAPAEVIPEKFALQQNGPNPFTNSTFIRYDCPTAAHVSLKVYDTSGREVIALLESTVEAGSHTAEWNGRDASGRDVASGIYFCRIVTRGYSETRKMLLIR